VAKVRLLQMATQLQDKEVQRNQHTYSSLILSFLIEHNSFLPRDTLGHVCISKHICKDAN